MARFSLSLSLSLLLLFVAASGAYAQVQDLRADHGDCGFDERAAGWYEIGIASEYDFVLEIWDISGAAPHLVFDKDISADEQACENDNCGPVGNRTNCQLVVHFGDPEGMYSPDRRVILDFATLYRFDFVDAYSKATTSVTYYRCTDEDEGSFYCPYDRRTGSADMFFHLESDLASDLSLKMKMAETWDQMGGGYIDDHILDGLGNPDPSFMLPYDWVHACNNSPYCSDPSSEIDEFVFVTKQDGSDGTYTRPDADLFVLDTGTSTWEDSQVEVLQFTVGTRLIVEGDLTLDGVTLTKAGSQKWGGVAVSGSFTTDGATVEHAAAGVTVYQPGTATITSGSTLRHNTVGLDVLSSGTGGERGATVSGSVIENNGLAGVRTGIPQAGPGAPVACLGLCRSTLSLIDAEVRANGSGVVALDANVEVDDSFIQHNGGTGLRVSNANISPITETCIQHNGDLADAAGVTVLPAGDLFLSPANAFGFNRIAYSALTELVVADGGYVFAGDATGDTGQNAIFDDNTQYPLVANGNKDDVQAYYTYWGGGLPPSNAFSPVGSTDFFPHYLSNDPTFWVCDVSDDVAGDGAATQRAANPDSGEALRGGLDALGETIRATRAALTANPAADSSAALVGRLYGLHKLDPDDALGERAATFGLLRSLQARLGTPSLPSALRATAEAAVAAGALDALTRGEHGHASEILAAWGEEVEDVSTRRVLGVAEAHLTAAAGDYRDASSLMEVAAEGVEDEALRGEMLAVAAIYAERGGSAEARGTGAATLARTGAAVNGVRPGVTEHMLSVYPNPTRGAATVVLTLEASAEVEVAVYDVLGRRVAVLAEGLLEAGAHRFAFDSAGLPAGLYLVRVEGGEHRLSERITLLR